MSYAKLFYSRSRRSGTADETKKRFERVLPSLEYSIEYFYIKLLKRKKIGRTNFFRKIQIKNSLYREKGKKKNRGEKRHGVAASWLKISTEEVSNSSLKRLLSGCQYSLAVAIYVPLNEQSQKWMEDGKLFPKSLAAAHASNPSLSRGDLLFLEETATPGREEPRFRVHDNVFTKYPAEAWATCRWPTNGPSHGGPYD